MGATRQAGKNLFRAANVWWRCAQYFVIMSVVVMGWGSVGMGVV